MKILLDNLTDKWIKFVNDPTFPIAVKRMHGRHVLRLYQDLQNINHDTKRMLGLIEDFLSIDEPVLDWKIFGF